MKTWLLLAATAVVAVPIAWFVAGKLHRFAYWIGRKSDAEVAALASNGWRVDRLDVAPGVTLVGLVRPPQRADAPWILFAPGNSSALLDGFQKALDEVRGSDDVGIAFHAYRGFDASGGTPSPAALAADLLQQWQQLRGRGIAAGRIQIWGYSLGSILAAQLAAAVADTGEAPARLVMIAAGERIDVMQHGALGRFLPDDVFDLSAALPRITCPVVIVHGADDDALPVAGARAIAARLGARATLHEVAGKGHFDLWPDARARALH